MASITYNTNKYFNGTIKDFMAKYNALHNNAATKDETTKFDDAITFIGDTKTGRGEGFMIKMEASDGTKTPVCFKTLGSSVSLKLAAKSGNTQYEQTVTGVDGTLEANLSTGFLDNVYLNKSAASSFRLKDISPDELKASLMVMDDPKYSNLVPLEDFRRKPASELGGSLRNTYINLDLSQDKQSPLLYNMVPTRQDRPEVVYLHKLYTYPCVSGRPDPSDKSPKVYVYEGDITDPLNVQVSGELMYDRDNVGYFTTERKLAKTTNYLLENKQDKRSDIDTFRSLMDIHTTDIDGVKHAPDWSGFVNLVQNANSGSVITAGAPVQSPIIYKIGANYAYIPKLHSLGRTADMSPKVYLLQDDVNGVNDGEYVMYNHIDKSPEELLEADGVGPFTTERRLTKMVMYLSRQVQALTQEITNLKAQLGTN